MRVFIALRSLAFYKWVKLLLHRIDMKFYWEAIRHSLGKLVERKLAGTFSIDFDICSSIPA